MRKPTVNDILEAHESTHGDYTQHSDITQRLKAEMRNSPNWEDLSYDKAESLEMIQHKIGRILAGDPEFKDHWEDIAGYATLVSRNLEG